MKRQHAFLSEFELLVYHFVTGEGAPILRVFHNHHAILSSRGWEDGKGLCLGLSGQSA